MSVFNGIRKKILISVNRKTMRYPSKKIKTKFSLLSFLILIPAQIIYGQSEDSTEYPIFHRHYDIGIAPNFDLHNLSRNSLTTFKVSQDAFNVGVRQKLPKKLGNVLTGVWSFSMTYLHMIWPHEFGHSMRARQIGGQFHIHNSALPFPYTTMELPDNASYIDRALSVTGGFEVNYLTSSSIRRDFYEYNGLYNDELALSFANNMMFIVYTNLVVGRNPKDPDTWVNTAGDPVHIVHPVWQEYSNNEVIMPDSIVNPGLVKFYNQSWLFGALWQLADPYFYKQTVGAFSESLKGKRPWYWVGDYEKGWTTGTSFNMSPLGYELYLNNFVNWNDRLFEVSLKYGRPFKNNSLILSCPDVYDGDVLKIGARAEVWDQDIFGTGFSAIANASFKFQSNLAITTEIGYKSDGYSLGRSLDESLILWMGLQYSINE